ncbi:hypothetical protein HK101_003112 [Irineochytrium annulatum]|nr:hypothetical protein HK101_003112 [Irineochytrium annulatum]
MEFLRGPVPFGGSVTALDHDLYAGASGGVMDGRHSSFSASSSLLSTETPPMDFVDADDVMLEPASISRSGRDRKDTGNSTDSISSSSTSFENSLNSAFNPIPIVPFPSLKPPILSPTSPESADTHTSKTRRALSRSKWPSAVIATIVRALMHAEDVVVEEKPLVDNPAPATSVTPLPSLPSLKSAMACMMVNRAWARGTAKAIYRRPVIRTLQKFQALVSTVLDPNPFLPYAAFVNEFHLNSALADALDMGDLDIAFQLFPNLSSFRIDSSPSTTNVLIQSLSDHCVHLHRLSLRGCPITDALIPALAAGCPKIEHLDLSHTLVTVSTLVTAVDLCGRLRSLRLEGAAPSSAPLTWDPQHLYIRPLRVLDMRNSGVTDPHVRHAALHCPDLQLVTLEGSAALTDDSVVRVAQSCSSVEVLDLSFCPHLTDLSMRALAMFARSSLRSLTVSGCDAITPDGIAAVAGDCKAMEEIVMHGCNGILGSWVAGFATRRYELDCAVRGHNIRLLAGAAKTRGSGAGAGAAAAILEEAAKKDAATKENSAAAVAAGRKREIGIQTSGMVIPLKGGEEEEEKGEEKDEVTATKRMSRITQRASMSAEDLLMKFAEAVASGTWMPRGVPLAQPPPPPTQDAPANGVQPLFWGPQPYWNPAWGPYAPPGWGGEHQPGHRQRRSPLPTRVTTPVSDAMKRVSTSSSLSTTSTRSSIAEFSMLPQPSKLKRPTRAVNTIDAVGDPRAQADPATVAAAGARVEERVEAPVGTVTAPRKLNGVIATDGRAVEPIAPINDDDRAESATPYNDRVVCLHARVVNDDGDTVLVDVQAEGFPEGEGRPRIRTRVCISEGGRVHYHHQQQDRGPVGIPARQKEDFGNAAVAAPLGVHRESDEQEEPVE